MRLTRRSLSSVGASLAAAAIIFAACTDRDSNPVGPTGGGDNPKGGPSGVQPTIQIECRADIRNKAVECGAPVPATGASKDDNSIFLGDQGVNVRLRSSNIVVTPADSTFAFDERIINLLPQAIGTTDGTTADPAGSQVYFANSPAIATTGGTGQVSVSNPDGLGTFTASNQPYYQYVGVVAPGDSTGVKTWKFKFDPGVNTFSFRVFVYTPVKYPQGWIDITPASSTVSVGDSVVLHAVARNRFGTPVGGTISWQSSNNSFATVSPYGSGDSAKVKGVAKGNVTITATSPSGMSAPFDLRTGTASVVVNNPPVSTVDSFPAFQRVTLTRSAPGLLTNVSDPDAESVQVVAGTYTTANGGTVVAAADGSFTYLSAAGYSGNDALTYQVTDGVQTVNVNAVMKVTGTRLWYVKAGATGTTDGRDQFPFATIADAEGAAAAGDSILVLTNGVQQVDGPAVLKNNQVLLGQGIPTSIKYGYAAGDSVTVLAAGAAPGLTRTTAGAAVTLAQNNTIRGVGITAGGGAAITGNTFGTLTVSQVGVNPAGPALDLTNGTLAAAFDLLSSTGSSTTGLSLTNVGGTLSTAGGSISNATGTAFNVSGGTLTFSYGGTISNSAGLAVSLSGVGGGAITLAGAITDSGDGISVTGTTAGTIAFTSALTLTGKGIAVGSNTGGTISFTGASKSISTGANQGVNLSSNTGATITFGGGGLAVTTTSAQAFGATGGGIVTVTGAGNTLASGTGTALGLAGVNTGASGLSFASASSNGATNGISISTITGAGVQVNGGLIKKTTGWGVDLASTGSVPILLSNLTVDSAGTAGAGGIKTNGVDSLVASAVSVLGVGGPALSATTGKVYGTFGSLSSTNSSTSGVILTTMGGSFTASGGTILNAASTGFAVAGGTVSATYQGDVTQSANNAALVGVSGSHTGALVFNTGTLSATTGSGISLLAADGSYTFNGTTSLNGGDAHVAVGSGTDGVVTFAATASITNPTTSPALDVNPAGGNPALVFAGSITNNLGRAVSVQGMNGDSAVVTGNVSGSGAGATGIFVNNNTGGTIAFDGTSKALTTAANAAVTLTTNTGAKVRFAGGGLAITTTTGAGFTASGGGTLEVRGAGNTISTTTGQALNLSSIATDATNGVLFASVSASGAVPTNAIAISSVTGMGVQVNGGTLAAATGHTVSLSTLSSLTTGVVLNNMTISGGTGGNAAIFGSTFGTLSTSGTSVTGTGGPALNLSTGTVTGTFASVSGSASASNGVTLADVAGTWTVSGGTVAAGTAGAALSLTGNSGGGTLTWAGALSQANASQPLVNVSTHTNGTLSVTGSAKATNGTGLQFSNADGSYSFAADSMTNAVAGGDAGIDVLAGSSGTFSFGTASVITNPANEAMRINASSPTFTYSGRITKNNGSTGITVSSNTGGTISFGSRLKTITSTGGNVAVNLATNTGATITSADSLQITSATGNGYNATGGGTVVVQGANNTITSVGGVALNVSSTTIGAANLTFLSISANGGANGIVLSNTGTSGGLTVTGTGTANSGGTLQNQTGAGVALTTTRNVKFNNVRILNTTRSGVEGAGVVNFEFTNGSIDQSGDAPGVSANESNLLFYDFANTSSSTNLSGTVTITGNSLSNALNHGIYIYNRGGTISDLNISNNVITTPTTTTASLGSGINIDLQGGGASITKGNVDNNNIYNVPTGAGIILVCGGVSASGTCGTPGSATNVVSISKDTIWGASAAAPIGSEGLVANMNGQGQGNFVIDQNNIKNTKGRGMGVSAFGQVRMQSAVTNNVIVSTPLFDATNMEIGADSTSGIASFASYTATVTGNNVSGHTGVGIYALARGSSDTLKVKLISNTVAAPNTTTSARAGIRVDAGSAAGAPVVCARVESNTTAGSTNTGTATTSPGINIREQAVSGANFGTLRFHNLSPSPATTAQGLTFVSGQNPASTSGTFGSGGVANLSGSPTFEACTLP